MNLNKLSTLILSAALTLASCADKDKIQLETATVSAGAISETVTATGTLESVTQVDVGTQVTGKITKLFADYNSVVKKGELIAEIDKTLLESEVEAANANLESARSTYEYRKTNYERDRKLHDKKLISDYDYETSRNEYDVARLTRNSVEFFAEKPVMAMLSYSSFGSSKEPVCRRAHDVVEMMHSNYPDLLIDGEMTIRYALNNELRDKTYPFNRLAGEKVNTLVFPDLTSASSAYRLLLEFGVGDTVGPIQMGLNKAIHYIGVDAPVRSILNLAVIAALDAQVAATGVGSQDK